MIRNIAVSVLSITFGSILQATVIDTSNSATVSAFQSGATFGGAPASSAVPEPGVLGLFACGLAGLLFLRQRR